jgi:DNA-binding transcriptional MocR family regulator
VSIELKVELNEGSVPKYRQIVDWIAQAINTGELTAGQRLPTMRALAEQLGVTVGTINRAYAQAERQGLVISRVGSGCYVQQQSSAKHEWIFQPAPEFGIGMWQNQAITLTRALPLMEQLDALAQRGAELDALLDGQEAQGWPSHRKILCDWLDRCGIALESEQLLFSYGAQHSLLMSLMAIQAAGGVVLCESLTYPGIISLAKQLGVTLKGVAMDEQGVCPQALEAAIEQYCPKAVYLTPTLQNPTTRTMPLQRRELVVAICRRHNLWIIEDDVCGLLPEKRPPALVSLAPDLVLHLGSFSKGVMRGLRFGYWQVPERLMSAATSALRTSCWQISPLLVELACGWVSRGEALSAIEAQRRELAVRAELMMVALQDYRWEYHPGALHLWLELPEQWRSSVFIGQCEQQGVRLSGAEHFTLGGLVVPNSLRISLGQPATRTQFEQGLEVIVRVLAQSAPSIDLV